MRAAVKKAIAAPQARHQHGDPWPDHLPVDGHASRRPRPQAQGRLARRAGRGVARRPPTRPLRRPSRPECVRMTRRRRRVAGTSPPRPRDRGCSRPAPSGPTRSVSGHGAHDIVRARRAPRLADHRPAAGPADRGHGARHPAPGHRRRPVRLADRRAVRPPPTLEPGAPPTADTQAAAGARAASTSTCSSKPEKHFITEVRPRVVRRRRHADGPRAARQGAADAGVPDAARQRGSASGRAVATASNGGWGPAAMVKRARCVRRAGLRGPRLRDAAATRCATRPSAIEQDARARAPARRGAAPTPGS